MPLVRSLTLWYVAPISRIPVMQALVRYRLCYQVAERFGLFTVIGGYCLHLPSCVPIAHGLVNLAGRRGSLGATDGDRYCAVACVTIYAQNESGLSCLCDDSVLLGLDISE